MHHTSTHCCESPHLSMKKKHMLNSRFWTNSQTRLNPITAWASPISFSVKWRGILPLMESQFTTDQVKFPWQSVGTHSYSWMERGAEGSIVTHLTWLPSPIPTHSFLAPSLHFVRFPEPISPLGRRQTLWKIDVLSKNTNQWNNQDSNPVFPLGNPNKT